MSEPEALDADVRAGLVRLGLVGNGEAVTAERLAGGVSSDIWKVETATRTFCVKRALAKLKVAQDWRAPVERSAYEAKWMAAARAFAPDAVPDLLGYDNQAQMIALAWYDPGEYKLWKSELETATSTSWSHVRPARRSHAFMPGPPVMNRWRKRSQPMRSFMRYASSPTSSAQRACIAISPRASNGS